jgi:hypothetical protein
MSKINASHFNHISIPHFSMCAIESEKAAIVVSKKVVILTE